MSLRPVVEPRLDPLARCGGAASSVEGEAGASRSSHTVVDKGTAASITRSAADQTTKVVDIMSNITHSRSSSGWADWLVFAGVILVINGGFNVIQGIVALVGPDAYFASVNGSLFIFNVEGWAWWNLIIGALQVIAALALFFSGAGWARIVAVILASLSAFVQMILIPVQPWWSLIVIAVDVLIIYALVAHGRELRDEGSRNTA
ncbi:hypothetical protein [Glaciihabitans sp. dw_435]|uniref:DUF7144 family membrane protein n=1 Tax=Glaciihabitans sp. dw_435 TaxID=2720081 RepID=UPI0021068560|nr:hypothetical protein [Glaciihabitans sp. dw_435]